MSECGTWSHAVISSLGARARGGWSGACVSVSHVVGHRQRSGFDELGWVTLGPVRARQGPVWSRMGPYISRTPIRDSRVIRRDASGPVGPYRVPTGFRRNPVWYNRTRRVSTHHSTVPYWCMIDVRSHTGPYGGPTGPPGLRRDPTGFRRTAGGTVGPRLIGASPVWAARNSYWRSRGYSY